MIENSLPWQKERSPRLALWAGFFSHVAYYYLASIFFSHSLQFFLNSQLYCSCYHRYVCCKLLFVFCAHVCACVCLSWLLISQLTVFNVYTLHLRRAYSRAQYGYPQILAHAPTPYKALFYSTQDEFWHVITKIRVTHPKKIDHEVFPLQY